MRLDSGNDLVPASKQAFGHSNAVGLGIADILTGKDQQPPGDEFHVSPPLSSLPASTPPHWDRCPVHLIKAENNIIMLLALLS